MPTEVLARLNAAMATVLVQRFAELTAERSYSTPQELAAKLEQEERTVVSLIKKLEIKAE